MVERPGPCVHPLNVLATQFDPTESPERSSIHHTAPGGHALRLEPRTIKAPALLLDHQLRIIWQNEAARSRIWQQDIHRDEVETGLSVFDLLFDSRFQAKVDNWRHWTRFFLHQARSYLPEETLQDVIASRQGRAKAFLQSMLDGLAGPSVSGSISSDHVRQTLTDGMTIVYLVIGTTFDQQRLIVFQPYTEETADAPVIRTADLEERIEGVRRHHLPVSEVIYVLAARLHGADTLHAEMLEEEYGQLVSRVLKTAVATLEKYGSLFYHHSGCGFLGYFLPVTESEKIPLHVIQCALDLKAAMSELGREWKIRKGWLHDIELNIGISAGHESLMVLPTSLGERLMPLGHTQRMAVYLSELAADGQIWITKELISRIPSRELKHLRFGIFRGESRHPVFISDCFSRIRDLAGAPALPTDIADEMGTRAVAQIFDRQGRP